MLDPATLTTLIASAVAVLSPLLGKAVDKGAEKIGELTITSLIDKFKSRVPESTKEAVSDLAQNPSDADQQATLRTQLKKAIQADPELATFLKEWLTEAQPVAKAAGGVTQTATINGNGNSNFQIAGNGVTIYR